MLSLIEDRCGLLLQQSDLAKQFSSPVTIPESGGRSYIAVATVLQIRGVIRYWPE